MENLRETPQAEAILAKLEEIVLFLEEVYSFPAFGDWVIEDSFLKFKLNSSDCYELFMAESTEYSNSYSNLASEAGIGREFLEKLGASLTIDDSSFINHLHQLAITYNSRKNHRLKTETSSDPNRFEEVKVSNANSSSPPKLTPQQYQKSAKLVLAKTNSFSSAFGGWENYKIGDVELCSKRTSESLANDFMGFIAIVSGLKPYQKAFFIKKEDHQYRIICDLDCINQISYSRHPRELPKLAKLTQEVGYFKNPSKNNEPSPNNPQDLRGHQVTKSNSNS